MQCPVCEAGVSADARICQSCGTRFAPPRAFSTAPADEFTLTAEEVWEPGENGYDEEASWAGAQAVTLLAERQREAQELRWGGFFRRALAFVIDALVLAAICAILSVVSFVGYKVGLAAHGRQLSADNAPGLAVFLTWGWMFLITIYFVVFHGMDGQTVGKRLFGLRLIGERGAPVSYKRAALRWVLGLLLAPLVVSWLWIIWDREKRAWHDYLARTWVVRT